VSLRAALRHRAQMSQAFGLPKPRIARAVRIRPARYAHAAQLAYIRALLDVVATIRAALERHIVPALPALVAAHAATRPQPSVFDARGQRIAIVGAPRAGKTTLALELGKQLGMSVQSSDDLIPLGWSEASSELADRIAAADSGIFEGVAVIRALRKLLERSRDKPVDHLLVLHMPHERLTSGQAAMAAGVRTVLQATLPTLIARGVEVYHDADQLRAALPARLDAEDDDPTVELFDRVRADVESDVPSGRISLLAQQNALRVDEHVAGELKAQIKQVVAIDLHAPDTGVPQHVRNFVAQQITLVKGLTEKTLADTHSVVLEGIRQGLRAEEIAKQLREQVGLSKTRATIIANDQVGKLHGELTRLRQTSLGIKRYRWATSRDELVRPGHRALEGTTQSWDEPPVVNARTGKRAHPGMDTHFYPCRCSAIPIIDDLLEEAGLNTVPPPAPPPANTNEPANTNAKPKRARAKPKPAALPPEHTPEHWIPHYAKEYGAAAPQVAWGRAMSERGGALALDDFWEGADALRKSGIEYQDPRTATYVRELIAERNPRTIRELLDAMAADPDISDNRRAIAGELRVAAQLVSHQRALKGSTARIKLSREISKSRGARRTAEELSAARSRAKRFYETMTHKDVRQPVDYHWHANSAPRASQNQPPAADRTDGRINFGVGHKWKDPKLIEDTLHEWGHSLESLNGSRLAAAVDFLDARTVGEAAVELRSVPGLEKHGYGAEEITKPDKLFHAYVGKVYKSRDKDWLNYSGRFATEVTSMGVQHMHDVTTLHSAVVSQDPDFLDFILGQLANR
jgi:SPP1 gp7 family putative phage head morphogenesis protein